MWGLAPVATRALVIQLAPLPLLVLRISVAGVVLLPWCAPLLRRPGRAVLTRLLAAGLLGMVGYNLPVTIGIQWIPASTAGLVLASEPIWILALGRVFLAERISRRSWAGAAVTLGGIAILAGPGALAVSSGPAIAGVALVMLGTLFFGAYTLVLRPLSQTYGPLPATAASTLAGALPYLVFARALSPGQLGQLPAAAWGELGFLALGSTVAGMLLWNLAVSRLASARVGLLLYLEPLVSVAGSVTLLGEQVSAGMAIGGLLVLVGVGATWTTSHKSNGARGVTTAADVTTMTGASGLATGLLRPPSARQTVRGRRVMRRNRPDEVELVAPAELSGRKPGHERTGFLRPTARGRGRPRYDRRPIGGCSEHHPRATAGVRSCSRAQARGQGSWRAFVKTNMEDTMATVVADMSMSLDGFVADPSDDVGQVFAWYGKAQPEAGTNGPDAAGLGVIVYGRRTFEIAGGWGGNHPMGVP